MFYPVMLVFVLTAAAIVLTERIRRTRIERQRREARRSAARGRPQLFHN